MDVAGVAALPAANSASSMRNADLGIGIRHPANGAMDVAKYYLFAFWRDLVITIIALKAMRSTPNSAAVGGGKFCPDEGS
ncbi:hypothetical protein [Paraburkholderia sp.]|uniref:hypothetical protein n=1 Tax=Paraburkholderia sp. TaxID=1926495 RepID=UPI002580C7BC|nr:hypothetical protein [Paraburkholderia sp.]